MGLLGPSVGLSWAPPGAHSGASWGPLVLVWGLMGPSGLLGAPGAHSGLPGLIPQASWASFWLSARLLAHFGSPGAHFGILRPPGFHFGLPELILGLLRPPDPPEAYFGPPETSWAHLGSPETSRGSFFAS